MLGFEETQHAAFFPTHCSTELLIRAFCALMGPKRQLLCGCEQENLGDVVDFGSVRRAAFIGSLIMLYTRVRA